MIVLKNIENKVVHSGDDDQKVDNQQKIYNTNPNSSTVTAGYTDQNRTTTNPHGNYEQEKSDNRKEFGGTEAIAEYSENGLGQGTNGLVPKNEEKYSSKETRVDGNDVNRYNHKETSGTTTVLGAEGLTDTRYNNVTGEAVDKRSEHKPKGQQRYEAKQQQGSGISADHDQKKHHQHDPSDLDVKAGYNPNSTDYKPTTYYAERIEPSAFDSSTHKSKSGNRNPYTATDGGATASTTVPIGSEEKHKTGISHKNDNGTNHRDQYDSISNRNSSTVSATLPESEKNKAYKTFAKSQQNTKGGSNLGHDTYPNTTNFGSNKHGNEKQEKSSNQGNVNSNIGSTNQDVNHVKTTIITTTTKYYNKDGNNSHPQAATPASSKQITQEGLANRGTNKYLSDSENAAAATAASVAAAHHTVSSGNTNAGKNATAYYNNTHRNTDNDQKLNTNSNTSSHFKNNQNANPTAQTSKTWNSEVTTVDNAIKKPNLVNSKTLPATADNTDDFVNKSHEHEIKSTFERTPGYFVTSASSGSYKDPAKPTNSTIAHEESATKGYDYGKQYPVLDSQERHKDSTTDSLNKGFNNKKEDISNSSSSSNYGSEAKNKLDEQFEHDAKDTSNLDKNYGTSGIGTLNSGYEGTYRSNKDRSHNNTDANQSKTVTNPTFETEKDSESSGGWLNSALSAIGLSKSESRNEKTDHIDGNKQVGYLDKKDNATHSNAQENNKVVSKNDDNNLYNSPKYVNDHDRNLQNSPDNLTGDIVQDKKYSPKNMTACRDHYDEYDDSDLEQISPPVAASTSRGYSGSKSANKPVVISNQDKDDRYVTDNKTTLHDTNTHSRKSSKSSSDSPLNDTDSSTVGYKASTNKPVVTSNQDDRYTTDNKTTLHGTNTHSRKSSKSSSDSPLNGTDFSDVGHKTSTKATTGTFLGEKINIVDAFKSSGRRKSSISSNEISTNRLTTSTSHGTNTISGNDNTTRKLKESIDLNRREFGNCNSLVDPSKPTYSIDNIKTDYSANDKLSVPRSVVNNQNDPENVGDATATASTTGIINGKIGNQTNKETSIL